MPSAVIEVPSMYADHHVIEVRRMLLDVPGVTAVNASSAFRIVEVEFEGTTADALEELLRRAGYCAELPVPEEPHEPAGPAGPAYRRHTTSDPVSGSALAFHQDLAPGARSTTEEQAS